MTIGVNRNLILNSAKKTVVYKASNYSSSSKSHLLFILEEMTWQVPIVLPDSKNKCENVRLKFEPRLMQIVYKVGSLMHEIVLPEVM